MGYLEMTNFEEITIYDEIVNCGILEEHSVLNFGAGDGKGKFIETLIEYNGLLEKGILTAIEPDPKKIKLLTKKFANEEVVFFETSLQSYIESEPENKDWVVITGVFDDHLYGEQQHDYVDSVIKSSMELSNKGVIFSIKKNLSEEFSYSMIYFFMSFTNTYHKVTVKKVDDNNYVFCIFK